MKRLLTTMAVLAVFVTPAFAQDDSGSIGQITHPQDKYYNHPQDYYYNQNAPSFARHAPSFARHAPSFAHHNAANANARAISRVSRRTSKNVYDSQGHVIGSDPDPNVRLQMRMDENNFDE